MPGNAKIAALITHHLRAIALFTGNKYYSQKWGYQRLDKIYKVFIELRVNLWQEIRKRSYVENFTYSKGYGRIKRVYVDKNAN